MERIIRLEVVFQSRVSLRARKDVVRKDSLDGPYRNRTVEINRNIETGPGSNANHLVRHLVSETLKDRKSGEIMFYVRALFEHREPRRQAIPYFKTIIPRQSFKV